MKEVFSVMSMDLLGPFSKLNHGNLYVAVETDFLLKFVTAKELKNDTALDVAEFFVEEVILKYYAPKALLTDRGSHFRS